MSEKLKDGERGDEPGVDSASYPAAGSGSGLLTTPPGSADWGGDGSEVGALTGGGDLADEVNELDRPLRLESKQGKRKKGRRLVKAGEPRAAFTPEQRLLILDVWLRSGLSSRDFAPLVGLSKHTLLGWKQKFERHGPEGLMNRPRGGPRGSRLPEVTKRAALMLKESNPEYGCQKISDLLKRGPGLGASAGAVQKVLEEAGYEVESVETHPHRPPVQRFERAVPNQLWQSDIFTFTLKRQNRRLYLVAFLDDHSRYITSYGLYASASTALVVETLRAAIASYGKPKEVLTDNGPQYVTWRGVSTFHKELVKQGITHIVARPKRPETLGKIERFWGSLWRECVEQAVFLDVEDARRRVGLYIDGYNFHRPHQGIEGLVPADRFFGAAPEVLQTLKRRVAANALELAKHGIPRKPFYLTGQVGGKAFSVHAAGERVLMTRESGDQEEIELVGPEGSEAPPLPEALTPTVRIDGADEPGSEEPLPPGVSAVDEVVWPPGVEPAEAPAAAPGVESDSELAAEASGEEAQDEQ